MQKVQGHVGFADAQASQTNTPHSPHSFSTAGHLGRESPMGRGIWQKYAPQPSHCTGWRGVHGKGRVLGIGFKLRGELGHEDEFRLRRPETLKDRGREGVGWNVELELRVETLRISGVLERWDVRDVEVDMSTAAGVGGGAGVGDPGVGGRI